MKTRRSPAVRVSWRRTHVSPESKAFQESIGLHEPVTHGSTDTEAIVLRSVDSCETLTYHLMWWFRTCEYGSSSSSMRREMRSTMLRKVIYFEYQYRDARCAAKRWIGCATTLRRETRLFKRQRSSGPIAMTFPQQEAGISHPLSCITCGCPVDPCTYPCPDDEISSAVASSITSYPI